MQPLIYLSYGMTKSGSTLAYQLARTAMVAAGMDQPLLNIPALRKTKHINFIEQLEPWRLEAVMDQARALGHAIVLKTHSRPDQPIMRELLESGLAIGHACLRDPRDMALSMLDHGARSRKAGKGEFSEFHSVDAALTNIRQQTETLRQWLCLPNILPLAYEELAFDTVSATRKILKQLNIQINPAHIAEIVLDAGQTNKNLGKPSRHAQQMAAQTSAEIADEFAPLINQFILQRAKLPQTGHAILAAGDRLHHQPSEPAL